MKNNNNLLESIRADYENAKLVQRPKSDKILLNDYLYKGISVEIMPSNYNDFVIRFDKFEFFDKDALEKYFRKNLKHENVKFEVNSKSIYTYVSSRQSDNFIYEVFKYVTEEINKIITAIQNLLAKETVK